MCLGIPGKVIEIFDENGLKMGKIDYSGTLSKACLECVPEIRVGEYTIVHAGFGISILDEEEAVKSLEVWQQMTDSAAAEGLDVFGQPLDDGGDSK